MNRLTHNPSSQISKTVDRGVYRDCIRHQHPLPTFKKQGDWVEMQYLLSARCFCASYRTIVRPPTFHDHAIYPFPAMQCNSCFVDIDHRIFFPSLQSLICSVIICDALSAECCRPIASTKSPSGSVPPNDTSAMTTSTLSRGYPKPKRKRYADDSPIR